MTDIDIRPGDGPPKPVVLLTQRLTLPNGAHRHVVWCPWCEAQHVHGDHAGNRAPHCSDYDGRSPLALAGYDMKVVSEIFSRADRPAFPADRGFIFLRKFHRSIDLSAPSLRAALIGAIFAKKSRGAGVVHTSTGFRAAIMGAGWNIRYLDETFAEGSDLLALVSELFALPAGIGAVRVLEATTGAELDAQAALEIAAAVDNWRARGAPKNAGRRR